METVLFFTSASRHSCRKRLEGAQRYFRDSNIQIQIVERNYHKVNVEKLLSFWKPIGCIAECGSGADELRPEIFGQLPVVYLDNDPQNDKLVRFSVNPDIVGSAHLAARELLRLGFEDYAFVGFRLPLFWSVAREAAFAEAIRLNGRSCHIFTAGARHGTARIDALRKWLMALPKPCGLLAAFDDTAEVVLSACAKAGIAVPEQIAVLGIDNNEEICEHTRPSLSSVCPDFEKAGFLCAELLDLQLRNPKAKPQSKTYGIIGIVKRRSTTIFKRNDTKVAVAIEYIRLHACEHITIDDVASQMNCSRRTAEIRFLNLTGHTIQKEISHVRMANVFALLRRPNQAIDGIAHLCGYKSDSTLRYAFKAKTGLSMREWRKKEGIV